LKAGGKAGVVIKNTFLSNTDNATVSLRKSLLESCNLHTVLVLPTGAFTGASIQTVVLFFEKGSSTKSIWYYQLNLSRSLGKSNALNESDLEDFLSFQKENIVSENSWTLKVDEIDKSTYDLSPVNPNKKDLEYRKTNEILSELEELEKESLSFLHSINELNNSISNESRGWKLRKLSEVAEYFNGLTYSPKDVSNEGIIVLRSSNIQNDELDFSDIVRVNVKIKDKLIVKDGDILMCSRNGSKRLVGKTAPITQLSEEMTFGTFMMIIRSDYNPYLAWYFKTNNFKKQISGGENTMINQITRYMLDEVTLPCPPKSDLYLVAQKLDDLFLEAKKLEGIYQRKMDLLNEYKSSALNKAIPFDLKTEKALAI
jgi:hypothetical protein